MCKGATSEAVKYLFSAANVWWRCVHYFFIVARCLETIDVGILCMLILSIIVTMWGSVGMFVVL